MTGWLIFGAIIAALFVFDLLMKRGAFLRTALYVAIALGFGVFIWQTRGPDDAMKFYTGYALEMSLSLDNVFIISLIFTALSIPGPLRSRILTIGILSALVLRGIFIAAGTALVGAFDWLLIVAGAFLIFTGIKMVFSDEPEEVDLEKNRTLKFIKRFVPVTSELHGSKFFVKWRKDSLSVPRLYATPLFVALVLVEIADVIFAADSVPATLAVTTDPFLVYSSNIFAILGLRALYGVLEKMVNAFEHLDKAISAVLVFIGVKVVLAHTIGFHIENAISLGVVLGLLVLGILASLWSKHRAAKESA